MVALRALPDVTLLSGDAAPVPVRPVRDGDIAPGALAVVAPAAYEIDGEHARGGLGRILRARDRRLDRPVAVKELLDARSPIDHARFLREAMITARLQHPGIVPVYEAGRWPSGEPFYAMKLVDGEPLRDALAAAHTPSERLALLPRLLAVAEALAYAHGEGVIHRDLTPGNVLLGAFGEVVVVDWGLAKDLRADEPELPWSPAAIAHADMTRAGAVIGTPGYMPPEQAAGEPVDERADVYALGAMLYQLLAGQAPYAGNDARDVLARVRAEAPPSLDAIAPDAPRDLRAIIAVAMARDPADRYPTAGELADDLRRFLTGQLVGARDYDPWALARRWLRRHRTAVIAGSIAAVALAVTAAVAAVGVAQARDRAEARAAELTLAQARAQLDRDPTAALAWLRRYPDDAPGWAQAATIAAEAGQRGAARHVLSLGAPVHGVAFLGDRIAAVAETGGRIWDRDASPVAAIAHAGATVAAFDGERVATGGLDGAVRLAGPGGDARVVVRHRREVRHLRLGSGRLASLGGDGRLAVTDLADGVTAWIDGDIVDAALAGDDVITLDAGSVVRRHPRSGPAVELTRRLPGRDGRLATSPTGAIAVASAGEVAVVLGSSVRTLGRHDGEVTALAFAGDTVVSGGADRTLRIWRDTPQMFTGHGAAISALVVGPGGIASGDAAGDVRLWDATGDVAVLRGHLGRITSLAFAADGALASGGTDGDVRIWSRARAVTRLPGDGETYQLAFAGERLLATGRDGGVHEWRGAEHRVPLRFAGAAYALAVAADGTAIAGAWSGQAALLGADGAVTALPTGRRIWDADITADGRAAATADEDGTVRIWRRGAPLETHALGAEALSVALSPDGATAVATGADGAVRMYTGGVAHVVAQGMDRPSVFAFAGEDRVVGCAGDEGFVLDLRTGARRALPGHRQQVRAVAVSRDGRRVATGSKDATIRVHDLDGGGSIVLVGHTREVRSVAFMPDGKRLASASWDGTVRLWNLADGSSLPLPAHRGVVHRVAFAPDGRLAASGQDASVPVWRVADLDVPAQPARLRAWIDGSTSAALDDGDRPVTR